MNENMIDWVEVEKAIRRDPTLSAIRAMGVGSESREGMLARMIVTLARERGEWIRQWLNEDTSSDGHEAHIRRLTREAVNFAVRGAPEEARACMHVADWLRLWPPDPDPQAGGHKAAE